MSDTVWKEDAAQVEAVAEAWASIDGKLADYRRERDGKIAISDPSCAGHYEGYLAEAPEIIGRIRGRGFILVPIETP